MVQSVSVRLSVHNISYSSCIALNIFLKLVLYVYQIDKSKKTYSVIWSVKVIHSGQSSNVNMLCMRHTLNGLKFVHENKYIMNIRQFAEKGYMNLTVIMFFGPSVFLCYVPAPYLLNDWKLIKEMPMARILVVGW